MSTLGTEAGGPSIAALVSFLKIFKKIFISFIFSFFKYPTFPPLFKKVCSAIACIEIPLGGWVDLIPTLLAALSAESAATDLQKMASLETIGYICDGVVSTQILSLEFFLILRKDRLLRKN